MQTVKPRKSRKRRLIWANHRSVCCFLVVQDLFADSAKSRAERIPRWRVPGWNRAWLTSSDSERVQLLLLPSGLLLGPSDGGDDSRDRNFLKSLPSQVPAERQLWVACTDQPDSPATSKFAIRNDGVDGCAGRPAGGMR